MPASVYKFPFPDNETELELELPRGSRPLHVDVQKGELQLWALVPLLPSTDKRTFRIFGTGHPIPDGIYLRLDYINTFMTDGGTFVFHAFEVVNA